MVIKGKVIKGGGKARSYGVPTANLDVIPEGLPEGIYVGSAVLASGEKHPCVISWSRILEVHLLDWSDDLYGQELTVHVDERISDFVAFESDEQMKIKILSDIKKAREMT